jgi:hypothetical protein
MSIAEKQRLAESTEKPWKKWGPYLTERQWGTVREDYSPSGSAWEFVSHDQARSKAYRWGEEGIGGISDDKQRLCFALAFWNGKDPILKERMYGLTGNEGNHGEDPKEYWYYLDSTPTHSYMKMLYKYPQKEFPYWELVQANKQRGKHQSEYELIDTGIFEGNKYFDIFLEYAKGDTDDLLIKIRIVNKGTEKASLHVLPTIWFRNTWTWNPESLKPSLFVNGNNSVQANHPEMGKYNFYCEGQPEFLFCDNESNLQRLYGVKNTSEYCKDGIHEYVVNKNIGTINPEQTGTKASANYFIEVEGESEHVIHVRLTHETLKNPFNDFEEIFNKRLNEANEFYNHVQEGNTNEDLRNIQRQAFAGMMWGKQFYYFNVAKWLDGDPGQIKPPSQRKHGRNGHWRHLDNAEIISMPDKWEYPWYAAWDLAFHCVPIARIDVDFAKEQLMLFLRESYMHPNGQIPAYEWNFGDVNPPVHAWATLRIYQIDKKNRRGKGDLDFLEKAYHKLLLNFTWWVNQKDNEGNNIFEGGFLGLDNIGVFDRSKPLPTGGHTEQADGTSWMAMYSLNMLKISLELAAYKNSNYQETATKFMEHFLYIAGAINNIGESNISMWDDEDQFYYDILHLPNGDSTRLKVRSMVGLIPLFAVETLKMEALDKLPYFKERLEFFLNARPDLSNLVSKWVDPGVKETRLFSLLRGSRMKKILSRMLDETEFLSDYGVRALSKFHKDNPYEYHFNDSTFSVNYLPGDSDSGLFGGNSNWRGPIWFPVNYLILESLLKFYLYYGPEFKVEYPTNSGNYLNLYDVAKELSKRLMKIFTKDENGKRAVYSNDPRLQNDPNFNDYVLFYEYFHGDNGSGIGANHQTGWTGLIADMIHKFHD